MTSDISKHDAILIFLLSFFCLTPYLNLFISPIVCYFSHKTLQKIKSNPKQYGGKNLARIAFYLSIVTMVLSYPVMIYQVFF